MGRWKCLFIAAGLHWIVACGTGSGSSDGSGGDGAEEAMNLSEFAEGIASLYCNALFDCCPTGFSGTLEARSNKS